MSPFVQHGETALIIACKMGNWKVVGDLLKQNADPNIASNVCIINNYKDFVPSGLFFFLMGIQNGDTPLLLATERQRTEIVEMLLKAGAKPNEVKSNYFLPCL